MNIENEPRPFGRELLLDCYDCDPMVINSIDAVSDFLVRLVDTLGMNKQSPPFVFQSPKEFPDKAGLSGWVPLIESGIQIHTLTVTNFVSIDLYTCGKLDPREVEGVVKEFLRPSKVESQYLIRGKDYAQVLDKYKK